jgi:hypothetical protein
VCFFPEKLRSMSHDFALSLRRKSAAVLALGGVVATLSVAAPAAAQDSGFEVGLRTGYGVPLGEAVDGASEDINNMIAGVVPLWLDLGYRVTPNVFIGGYFQYGFGVLGENLDGPCEENDDVDCSVHSHRVGAQLHYHFSPRNSADPWLGIGFGYEWLKMGVEGDGGEFDLTARGFELANLQGGVDFYPADNFYLGPFLSFSLDQYSSVEADCSGQAGVICGALDEIDGDIDDKSIHNWLMIGVRGGYTGFGR